MLVGSCEGRRGKETSQNTLARGSRRDERSNKERCDPDNGLGCFGVSEERQETRKEWNPDRGRAACCGGGGSGRERSKMGHADKGKGQRMKKACVEARSAWAAHLFI